jgi:hypothetical protein
MGRFAFQEVGTVSDELWREYLDPTSVDSPERRSAGYPAMPLPRPTTEDWLRALGIWRTNGGGCWDPSLNGRLGN